MPPSIWGGCRDPFLPNVSRYPFAGIRRTCNSFFAPFDHLSARTMRPTFVSMAFLGLTLLAAQIPSAGAQNRNVRGCLSITDVNARIDCLEGQTQPPATIAPPIPSDAIRRPTQTRLTPSFDCRAAASSIERAICSDDELSGWDARMGQAFQQALRLQKDIQPLLESQRRWISLRDRTCGSTPEIPMSCLLEMTKQRASALSEITPTDASAVPQQPPATTITSQPSPATSVGRQPEPIPPNPVPSLSQPDNRPRALASPNTVAAPQISSQINSVVPAHQDGGTSPIIVLLGVGMAIWLSLIDRLNLKPILSPYFEHSDTLGGIATCRLASICDLWRVSDRGSCKGTISAVALCG
ncbi:MAG: hypothetical protein JWP25_3989 [Bradyrhizobium sp.]|nr:hypothetical protein [Bradyrhizobium sp.]